MRSNRAVFGNPSDPIWCFVQLFISGKLQVKHTVPESTITTNMPRSASEGNIAMVILVYPGCSGCLMSQ